MFIQTVVALDLNHIQLSYQGCISSKQELVRMEQAIAHKNQNEQVRFTLNKLSCNISPYR